MDLFLGNSVKSLYLGGEAREAWLGGSRVWSASKILGYAHIGEHDYPYVKIGSLLWIAENLREDTGTYKYADSVDQYYYNDSICSYTCDGWRVPSNNDFNCLAAEASSDDLLELKSTDMWETSGSNSTGFNLKPYGNINTQWSTGEVIYLNKKAALYSTTVRNSYDYYRMDVSNTSWGTESAWNTKVHDYNNVRLCKNAD